MPQRYAHYAALARHPNHPRTWELQTCLTRFQMWFGTLPWHGYHGYHWIIFDIEHTSLQSRHDKRIQKAWRKTSSCQHVLEMRHAKLWKRVQYTWTWTTKVLYLERLTRNKRCLTTNLNFVLWKIESIAILKLHSVLANSLRRMPISPTLAEGYGSHIRILCCYQTGKLISIIAVRCSSWECSPPPENARENVFSHPPLPFFTGNLSANEVRNAISKLNTNKTPGPDGAITELFKWLDDHTLEQLTDCLNVFWTEKQVPDSFTQAQVCCIYKKGAHDNPENYRPISLLNTSYKIFASIIQSRLANILEPLLGDTQYGFRTRQRPSIFNLFRLGKSLR